MKKIRVDHLGSVGTRLMLEKLKIASPPVEFVTRASASFPRTQQGDISRNRTGLPPSLENVPRQRRIFCYAEYEFVGIEPGAMLREHGFQGLRMWQKGWLRALSLPVSPHVDRSVCAEFQVLNELCDLISQRGLADTQDECVVVEGWTRVLASTTPCLSCVCAVVQFSQLLPRVEVQFGCVQPWHFGDVAVPLGISGQESAEALAPGGGRLREHSGDFRGASCPAKLTSAGHAGKPPGEALAKSPSDALGPGEAQRLLAACAASAPLAGALREATTWLEVRRALEAVPFSELAALLRAHRLPVKPERLSERLDRVLEALRGVSVQAVTGGGYVLVG